MFSDDLGDVDMFGLDPYGEPVGMKSYWGAAIGGAAAAGTAVAVRSMSKSPALLKHAEGVGLAAGVVAAGAMMAFKGSRHAGWSALASALAATLPRVIEQEFMAVPVTVPLPVAPPVSGWGDVQIEPTGVLRPLNGGLGIATIEPTGALFNGLGEGMPRLLGASPQNQREMTATLLGVPGLGGPLAAMAGSWGATLFGGGR